jgi:very-short-patch-repair endonuclease
VVSRIARRLRKNLTDAERKLWSQLRYQQLGGYRFRRQHPMRGYVVDFVCLSEKLVIEVDGGQHAEQTDADEERTRTLEKDGFRVLRFWNNEVLQNTDGVVEVIREALGKSR